MQIIRIFCCVPAAGRRRSAGNAARFTKRDALQTVRGPHGAPPKPSNASTHSNYACSRCRIKEEAHPVSGRREGMQFAQRS